MPDNYIMRIIGPSGAENYHSDDGLTQNYRLAKRYPDEEAGQKQEQFYRRLGYLAFMEKEE